jgi:hypothetical protein
MGGLRMPNHVAKLASLRYQLCRAVSLRVGLNAREATCPVYGTQAQPVGTDRLFTASESVTAWP